MFDFLSNDYTLAPWDASGLSFMPAAAPTTGGTVGVGGPTATVGASSTNAPWWQVLIGDGLTGLRTWLGYDLANEQVAKGQYPTVAGVSSGVGGLNLGGILPIVVLLVVAFVGLSLLKSVLK